MNACRLVLARRNKTQESRTAENPSNIDTWRNQACIYHHALVLSQLARGRRTQSKLNTDLGAAAVYVYKACSRGTLEDLQDRKKKLEEQLASLHEAEVNAKQNFKMKKQFLENACSKKNMAGQAQSLDALVVLGADEWEGSLGGCGRTASPFFPTSEISNVLRPSPHCD